MAKRCTPGWAPAPKRRRIFENSTPFRRRGPAWWPSQLAAATAATRPAGEGPFGEREGGKDRPNSMKIDKIRCISMVMMVDGEGERGEREKDRGEDLASSTLKS